MPEPVLLQELPESEATGEVRHIYGEIRRLSAVPMVALIYRHLATIPGALEWAWTLLEPAMRAGAVQQSAWRLAQRACVPRQPAIPAAALRAVGISEAHERAIAQVLEAYNRANPVNIVAVRCLSLHLAGAAQAGAGAGQAPVAWEPPAAIGALPPMVNPQAMTSTVRELAILLTDRGATEAPSPLWPSLYRHLAHWPAFLGYAAVLVPPEFEAIDAAAGRLRQRVDDAAATLASGLSPSRPEPTGAQASQLQAAITQFSARIPEMVVIGNLLRGALRH